MKLKNINVFVFALLIATSFLEIAGQNYNYDPKFKDIPKSPQYQRFNEVSLAPVNMSNGQPSFQIDLFTITLDWINLPITLKYNSFDGIKVNQDAGSVGLGWDISYGGKILRNVRSAPDVLSGVPLYTFSRDYVLNSFKNTGKYPSRKEAHTMESGYIARDFLSDIYTYNLPEAAGVMMLDETRQMRDIDMNNLDVQYHMTGFNEWFKIFDANGVLYSFNSREVCTLWNLKSSGFSDTYNSGWFLDKIENTTKTESVDIVYETFKYKNFYKNDIAKSGALLFFDKIIIQKDGYMQPTSPEQFEYETKLPTEITYANVRIVFNYENRPDLNYHEDEDFLLPRIHNIEVFQSISGSDVLYKKIEFDYEVFRQVDNNVKSKLKKIKMLDSQNNEINSYVFNYIDEEGLLPKINSKAQDYFGYYNGQVANKSLVPLVNYFNQNNRYVEFGDNRDPNFNFTQKWVLNEVVYPTGGKQIFIYEPNEIEITNANRNYERILEDNALALSYSHMSDERIVTIHIPDDINTVEVQVLYEGADYGDSNTYARLNNQFFYQPFTYRQIQVQGGQDLTIAAKSTDYLNVLVSIEVNMYSYKKITKEKHHKGLRISKIKLIDKDTILEKNYQYFSNNREGIGTCYPTNELIYNKQISNFCLYYTDDCCTPNCLDYYIGQVEECYIQYSTNPIQPIEKVCYDRVVETFVSDEPKGKNEYHFSLPVYEWRYYQNGSDEFKFIDERLGGKQKVKIVYNALGDTIRKEISKYKLNEQAPIPNFDLKPKYGIVNSGLYGCFPQQLFDPTKMGESDFCYLQYDTKIHKELLEEQKTISYFKDKYVTNVKAYSHNENSLVKTITNYDSSGDIIEEIKYPSDYTGNSELDDLCSKNIISLPIDIRTSRNGKLLKGQQYKYNSYGQLISFYDANLEKIIKPVDPVSPYTFEKKINYKYGSNDKLESIMPINGMYQSLIWGYNSQYPVIVALNATNEELQSVLNELSVQGLPLAYVLDNVTNIVNDDREKAFWKNYCYTIRQHSLLKNAHIKFYTYSPIMGITSEMDNNGNTLYYDYDYTGRLKLIKDQDGNIIKKYDYNYKTAR